MEPTWQDLIAAITREGPRKHARWDATFFEELTRGPVRAVWQAVQGESQPVPVFRAYLQLVQEAVGAGYPRREQGGTGDRPGNFLSLCLVQLLPRSLVRVPQAERLPLLARVWNLGEGLLREPAWVDRFVTACAANLEEVSDLEGFLVRTLAPALAPAPPARWQGPFAVTVLDPRPVEDEFLPGDMHLAAPAVLCVHDRRRPDVHLGVFLQHDQRSRFLGVSPCLGQHPSQLSSLVPRCGSWLGPPMSGLAASGSSAPETAPAVRNTGNLLLVGPHTVPLPLLGRYRQHIVAGSGFAVASAVDSQRLWVMESR